MRFSCSLHLQWLIVTHCNKHLRRIWLSGLARMLPPTLKLKKLRMISVEVSTIFLAVCLTDWRGPETIWKKGIAVSTQHMGLVESWIYIWCQNRDLDILGLHWKILQIIHPSLSLCRDPRLDGGGTVSVRLLLLGKKVCWGALAVGSSRSSRLSRNFWTVG